MKSYIISFKDYLKKNFNVKKFLLANLFILIGVLIPSSIAKSILTGLGVGYYFWLIVNFTIEN